MSSVGWSCSAGGRLLRAATVLVALVLVGGSAVSAQSAPWNFAAGTVTDPPMRLTPLKNSGPSIALLTPNKIQKATALMAFYNADENPQLFSSLQQGNNINVSKWLGGPQPIPTNGQQGALTPISGASVCQTTLGVLAAWSTSTAEKAEFIAYASYDQTQWDYPTVACQGTSPHSVVQPAAAWNTDKGGEPKNDLVNIYSRDDGGVVYSADRIDYTDFLCQNSQQVDKAPVPTTAVGAAYDPLENNQAGQFFIFECADGIIVVTADGGETEPTKLECAQDTSIAAVFVSTIPLSEQNSGIVFFYKYLGAVYYGYRTTGTGQIEPADEPVGFSTGLKMDIGDEWNGGPGAVFYQDNSNMLVVYQGEAAGIIYQGWGTPAGQ